MALKGAISRTEVENDNYQPLGKRIEFAEWAVTGGLSILESIYGETDEALTRYSTAIADDRRYARARTIQRPERQS
jgi:hypothetical protein